MLISIDDLQVKTSLFSEEENNTQIIDSGMAISCSRQPIGVLCVIFLCNLSVYRRWLPF